MESCFVEVTEVEGDREGSVEVELETNGTLFLASLRSQFPSAVGLKYRHANKKLRGVKTDQKGEVLIVSTVSGWQNICFIVIKAQKYGDSASLGVSESQGSLFQTWRFKNDMLECVANEKVLDIDGNYSSSGNGAPVIAWHEQHGGKNQKFYFQKLEQENVNLISIGRKADLEEGFTGTKTFLCHDEKLQMVHLDNIKGFSPSQKWRLVSKNSEDGEFHIESQVQTGLYLTTSDDGPEVTLEPLALDGKQEKQNVEVKTVEKRTQTQASYSSAKKTTDKESDMSGQDIKKEEDSDSENEYIELVDPNTGETYLYSLK